MQVQGTLKKINETQEFGSNGFTKRDFVVTTEEQYPQHLLIELIKDKCSLLDNFKEGDNVTVSINLRGREWTNPQGEVKYFNSIQGWRIEANQDGQGKVNEVAQQVNEAMPPATEDDDSLPF